MTPLPPHDPNFPPKLAIPMGLAFIVFGSIPVLAALDVIPSPDESFHVPRWLAAVLSASFPAAGIYMLMRGLTDLAGRQSALGRGLFTFGYWCLAVMFFCFIGGLAVFFTWEFISPFPGAAENPGIISRVGAGFGMLVFDGIVAWIAWTTVKTLWRRRP